MSLGDFIENHYCKTLYRLARTADPSGVILELGVGNGGSGIWMCEGAKAGTNCPIYGIDNFSLDVVSYGRGKYERDLHGVVENILIMTTESASRIWRAPISLLFIDACHEGDAPLQDFNWFFPHVIRAGVVAFHDAERPNIQEHLEIIAPQLEDVVVVPPGYRDGELVEPGLVIGRKGRGDD